MDILKGSDIKKAIPLFDVYKSNQAVIYSVLENQFDGCVYTDNKDSMNWAILRTPFLQHFITGTPVDSCETVIEKILFETILSEQTEKEIVVFAISEQWHDILDSIFDKRDGGSDIRKIFCFNPDNYKNINRTVTPNGVTSIIELKKCMPYSHMDTWSVKLLIGNDEVSYGNAIMVGKGMAEIDIGTVEQYRNKGYATLAATLLIDKLIECNLIPTWSTWPFREESQRVAQKLGFTTKPDEKAWIWMEDM